MQKEKQKIEIALARQLLVLRTCLFIDKATK